MPKKFEDVFVGEGGFQEAKFRGALLKYARWLNNEDDDIGHGVIKVRNLDNLAETVLSAFENWINRKLEDSWYKKRDDYTDREELKEILVEFSGNDDEFWEKLLSNCQKINNTGGVEVDDLYEHRHEHFGGREEETGSDVSDSDDDDDVVSNDSSSSSDVVDEFVADGEIDTGKVHEWMVKWTEEGPPEGGYKTGRLLKGYEEGWMETLSRKCFSWVNSQFDGDLWGEVFEGEDSISFREEFIEKCREDKEFKEKVVRDCVEITDSSHAEMAIMDSGGSDEGESIEGGEDSSEEREEDDGDELGDGKDENIDYSTMREKGLLTVANGKLRTDWKKIRGTVVLFAKEVDEIEGPKPALHIEFIETAYYKWMLDKIGREWFDYTMNLVDRGQIQEQVAKVYNSHEEANKLMHDKYEYKPEELEGNTSKREQKDTDSESPNDGQEESKTKSITERKKKLRELEDEMSGGSSSRSSSSKGSQSGALGKFAEEHGTTDNINRKTGNSGGKLTEYENKEDEKTEAEGESEGEGEDVSGRQNSRSDEESSEDVDESGGDSSGFDSESGLGKFAKEHGTTEEMERKTNGHSRKKEERGESEEKDDDSEREDNGVEEETGEGEGGADAEGLGKFVQEYGETEELEKKTLPAPRNEILHGNSEKKLREVKKGYVDCCITSPPYWQLRDYEGDIEDEWDDGEWTGQLGHEPTPQLFAEHIADIMDGVYRVLKPEGSLWMNMGDTYGGKSGGHYDADDYDGESLGHDGNRVSLDASAVKEKSLAMVPQLCALELKKRGWILRNKIIWAKQVVFEDDHAEGITQPTAAKDRVVEKSAEMIYHFVKQKDYYYDLDPIRRPHKTEPGQGDHYSEDAKMRQTENHGEASHDMSRNFDEESFYSEGGANLPRVWQVNLEQSSDEHYASYPDKLVERPIKATCPDDGIVLDPFAGTGTTLKVAAELGRDYLGVEFSDKYIKIARDNVPDTKQMNLEQIAAQDD